VRERIGMTPGVLLVEEDSVLRWSLTQTLERSGYAVTAADGADAIARASGERPDLVLLDVHLARVSAVQVLRALRQLHAEVQIVILAAYGDIGAANEAVHLGAYDYVTKPVDFDALAVTLRNALETRQLRQALAVAREQQREEFGFGRIVGESPALSEAIARSRELSAAWPAAVLITGERGSGKHLLARALHYESSRRDAPLLALPCAGMPEAGLERTLFGIAPRSGGSIERTKGALELARGGSVLLEEITATSAAFQARLLTVIAEGRFRRHGGTQDLDAAVRIVFTTTRDPAVALAEGRLHAGLFARLRSATIRVPPLRERREDVPTLVRYFIERFARELGTPPLRVPRGLEHRLASCEWPGNVRELRNVVERVVLLSRGEDLSAESFLMAVAAGMGAHGEGAQPRFALPVAGIVLEDVERDLVRQALEMAQGNQSRAARLLGLTRDELRYRAKKFDLAHRSVDG
jgi:DNA-binding NtrC family response regulator